MGKFIIIVLAVVVLIFSAFSFLIGMARRFLGMVPRAAMRAAKAKQQQATSDSVLYHDSHTEVLRGESGTPQNRNYANIKDASFTESKTDTSSRR